MIKAPSGENRIGRPFWLGAGIFVAALTIRLVCLYQLSDSPTFFLPIVDSYEYHQMAKNLITEGTMPPTFFLQGFFYPFFLSRLHFFTGSSILCAKIFQAILGSLTCVLVYLLGSRLFDRTIGTIAGLITAAYGPVIFFETELLATSWACFWPLLLILLYLKAAGGKFKKRFFLLIGLCTGLAVITRAPFIPFAAASLVWLIVALKKAGTSYKALAGKTLALLVGAAIVLAFVAALSYLQTDYFNPLPHSGPLNLYVGNNPNPDQTISARPGSSWHRLCRLPRQHGAETPGQARSFFIRQVLSYATEQPKDFSKNMLYKTVQFFSSREIPRAFDMYLARRYSPLLSALVFKVGKFGFPFGLLLPLAIIGILTGAKKIPAPVGLFLVLYPITVIAVFVSARYRAPLIPVLSLFAAAGLVTVVDLIRTARWARLAACTIFVVLAGFASSVAGPFAPEKYNFEAEMHYCLGYYLWENDMLDKAQQHLSKAVTLNPDYADAQSILGQTLYQKGQYQQARQHLETAVALDPNSYSTAYYLGKTLVELGDIPSAIEQFERARGLAEDAGSFPWAAAAAEHADNCRQQKPPTP